MRKSTFFCLIVLVVSCAVQAADDAMRFRVYLKGKEVTSKSELPLSSASLLRRYVQGVDLDSTDYPISKSYIKTIQKKGYPIITQSRWMNTLVVSASDSSCIKDLMTLPFVRAVQLVWVKSASTKPPVYRITGKPETKPADSTQYYGKATKQIEVMGLTGVHKAGFRGAGKIIAVVDGGFYGVDTMPWFKDRSFLAVKDFTYPPISVFNAHTHGTSVLSLMASRKEYLYVGSAPDANYCLLRSEDMQSEQPIEEDYWAAAVEFADSLGADIVTSSLGYTLFDRSDFSYTKSQLNGQTALISQVANMAANKGLLMVNSAGNDGSQPWRKISFPADAQQVLTVGAVKADLTRSTFSSFGPTADGRIKPDVSAMGTAVYVVNPSGAINPGNGTSFSAPLVAGMAASLWSEFPNMKAKELINQIKLGSSSAALPDTIFGYGIPDAQKISQNIIHSSLNPKLPPYFCYPTTLQNKLNVAGDGFEKNPLTVVFFDKNGKKVLEETFKKASQLDISSLPASSYTIDFVVSKVIACSQKIEVKK